MNEELKPMDFPELSLKLTPAELISPAWTKMEAFIDNQLAELRSANDSTRHTEIQTAFLRGQIAMLKKIQLDAKQKWIQDENVAP